MILSSTYIPSQPKRLALHQSLSHRSRAWISFSTETIPYVIIHVRWTVWGGKIYAKRCKKDCYETRIVAILSEALVMCMRRRICVHVILVHHFEKKKRKKKRTYFLTNNICFSKTLLLTLKMENCRDTRSEKKSRNSWLYLGYNFRVAYLYSLVPL